jgi:hypothetical protein
MGRNKMTTAERIRAYHEKHPDAKPRDVAKALGVNAAYVYLVRSKMKGNPRIEQGGTEKAKAWLAVNPWFGKDAKATATKAWLAVNPWFGKDAKATAIAVATHQDLLKQGVVADSDEYYKLLDERMQDAWLAANPADPVNQPPHYKTGGIETIDFIEAKGLNYRLGNVVKYITRSDHKGNRAEDLKKALWYLQREIEKA